jgi:vitamin B12 transporter
MEKKLACLLFLLLGGVLTGRGQSDSLAVRELREVRVFGRSLSHYAAGSRLMSIDSSFLRVNNAASLAEALQFRTPIYIKSYGAGMLATPAFRGTSASHTAVLWHGLAISPPTLGQTDMSLVPLNSFSHVAVQFGSAGAHYGTGAIGGSILLSSSPTWEKGLGLQVQQDLASFGTYYTSLGGSYRTSRLSLHTQLYHHRSRNDFVFHNEAKVRRPLEKQEHAALHQQGFTQDLRLKLSDKSDLALRSWYAFSDNEVQPNMVAAHSHARLRNENFRLMTEFNQRSRLGTTTLRGAFFDEAMTYRDDQNHTLTPVKTFQAQAEHHLAWQEKVRFTGGAEGQHFVADVTSYGKKVKENRASVFGLLRYQPLPRLQLNAHFRQGFVTGFNPPPAPAAGFNLVLLDKTAHQLSWKGNVARGYRVPTLNDRYWPPGNAGLRPEWSWNYETGLQHKHLGEALQLTSELTYYRLLVDNWIQWIPGEDNGLWRPVNLKQVLSTGLEASVAATHRLPAGKLSAGATYGYTRSEQRQSYYPSQEPLDQQLIYVPRHLATGHASLTVRDWLLTANIHGAGRRFTSADHQNSLPAYALLNLAAGRSWKLGLFRLELIGKVNNVTNQVYQTMEYYAMPGRHYALSLRASFLSSKS